MRVHNLYRRKLTTPQDAVTRIRSDDTIVLGTSIAEPPALLTALADRVREGELTGIKVFSCLPTQNSSRTVLSPDLSDCIESNSWFVTEADRSRHKIGLSYYIPTHVHQIPRLMRENMSIDVLITTVSPMDRHGYFTFGASNNYNGTAARACRTLIIEVNENMPRVLGDNLLHISEVDLIVENHVPLLKSGTAVSIPRMDVQYLVTEFGSVNLKGKSTRDRALGIIGLAHPDFMERLLKAAEDMYLL